MCNSFASSIDFEQQHKLNMTLDASTDYVTSHHHSK
jgi:hypothetical protein